MAAPLEQEDIQEIAKIKQFLDEEILAGRVMDWIKLLESLWQLAGNDTKGPLPYNFLELRDLLADACGYYNRIWEAFHVLHEYRKEIRFLKGGVSSATGRVQWNDRDQLSSSQLVAIIQLPEKERLWDLYRVCEFEKAIEPATREHLEHLQGCCKFALGPSAAFAELVLITVLMRQIRVHWQVLRYCSDVASSSDGVAAIPGMDTRANEFFATVHDLKCFYDEECRIQAFVVEDLAGRAAEESEPDYLDAPTAFKEQEWIDKVGETDIPPRRGKLATLFDDEVKSKPYGNSVRGGRPIPGTDTILKPDRFKSSRRYGVALSFAGKRRRGYVGKVAHRLEQLMGNRPAFYDESYKAALARPNLDVYLQDLYAKESDLIVIFISAEYAQSQLCMLEWRAIRGLIATEHESQIMFLRFDETKLQGMSPLDGYLEIKDQRAEDIADSIFARWQWEYRTIEETGSAAEERAPSGDASAGVEGGLDNGSANTGAKWSPDERKRTIKIVSGSEHFQSARDRSALVLRIAGLSRYAGFNFEGNPPTVAGDLIGQLESDRACGDRPDYDCLGAFLDAIITLHGVSQDDERWLLDLILRYKWIRDADWIRQAKG